VKWYILFLTKIVITFNFYFETLKNFDSCIATGRGVGKNTSVDRREDAIPSHFNVDILREVMYFL